MSTSVRIMIIGDLVGLPGQQLFKKWGMQLKKQYKADVLVVNGENAAKDGRGISPKIITTLKDAGADVITTGNHAWDNKEVFNSFESRDDFIRPANYPSGCQGKGYSLFSTASNHLVAIVNLHGRVFVRDSLDCPFRTIESLILMLKSKTPIILVDFHAEATSEKNAMGLFVDGKVSCLVGTHTHVQTADERILPKGTGYITDLGASCSVHSVIGFQKEGVISRFLYHPKMGRFVVSHEPPFVLSGIVVDVDAKTGKALHIERIRHIDPDMSVT